MDDRTHLVEEIRAAREEKIRRERHNNSAGAGGLTAPRNPAFCRLRTLSADELAAHIQRLERDLDHLKAGPEGWATPNEAEMASASDVEGDT